MKKLSLYALPIAVILGIGFSAAYAQSVPPISPFSYGTPSGTTPVATPIVSSTLLQLPGLPSTICVGTNASGTFINNSGNCSGGGGGGGSVGSATTTYVAVYTGSSTLLGYASYTYTSSTGVLLVSNEIDIGTSSQRLYQNSNGGLRYQDNAGDGNGKQSIFTLHSPSTNPQEGDLSIVRSGSVNNTANASGSIWWDFSNQCYGSSGFTQLNCTVGSSPYGTFDEIQGINGSSTFVPLRIGWWNQNLGAEATNTVLEVQYNPSSSVAFGPWNDQSSTDVTYAVTILSTSTYNTNGILALANSTTGGYVFTVDNSGNASTSGTFNTAQTYNIGGSVKLSTNSGNTIVRSSNGVGLDINSNGTFGSCALCIATSGDVSIGTSTATNLLTVSAASGHSTAFIESANTQGYVDENSANNAMSVGTYTNSPLQFVVNNTNLAGGFATSTGDPFFVGGNNKVYLNTNTYGGYLWVQSDGSGDNGEDTIEVLLAPSSSPQEATLSLMRKSSSSVQEWMDIGSMNYNTTDTTQLDGGIVHINYISNDIQGAGTQFMPFVMQYYNQASGTFQSVGKPYYIADPSGSTAIGYGYLYDEAGIHVHNYNPTLPLQVVANASNSLIFALDSSPGVHVFSVATSGNVTASGTASFASTTVNGSLTLPTLPTSSYAYINSSGNLTTTSTPQQAILRGVSNILGGTLLSGVGTCIEATGTVTGILPTMQVNVSPATTTDVGDGLAIRAWASATNQATVELCSLLATITPVATTYQFSAIP